MLTTWSFLLSAAISKLLLQPSSWHKHLWNTCQSIWNHRIFKIINWKYEKMQWYATLPQPLFHSKHETRFGSDSLVQSRVYISSFPVAGKDEDGDIILETTMVLHLSSPLLSSSSSEKQNSLVRIVIVFHWSHLYHYCHKHNHPSIPASYSASILQPWYQVPLKSSSHSIKAPVFVSSQLFSSGFPELMLHL